MPDPSPSLDELREAGEVLGMRAHVKDLDHQDAAKREKAFNELEKASAGLADLQKAFDALKNGDGVDDWICDRFQDYVRSLATYYRERGQRSQPDDREKPEVRRKRFHDLAEAARALGEDIYLLESYVRGARSLVSAAESIAHLPASQPRDEPFDFCVLEIASNYESLTGKKPAGSGFSQILYAWAKCAGYKRDSNTLRTHARRSIEKPPPDPTR